MNVVITGGTKGIGKAIADAFAKEGANLAICARTESQLDEVSALFKKQYGTEIISCSVDVSKKNDVVSFANSIKKEWGSVDVLVNNAGVFIPGKIEEEADGVLEKMMETNLYSAYYLTRELLPAIAKGGGGHIFNICSIASLFAYPNGGSYSISKFALLGLSKVLREELKEKKIRVTSVLPGATWSNSWAGVDLPYERLMPAEDIASAVINAWKMSKSTVIEEIVLRPQLGDL